MSSKGVKRKLVVLDIPTKLRILDRLESWHKCVDLAKEFSVGKSTISDIKSAKDKIREFAVSCEGSTDGRHTMNPCSDEKLDKALSHGLLRTGTEELHYLAQLSRRRPFGSIISLIQMITRLLQQVMDGY